MKGSRTEGAPPEEILPGGNTSVVVRVGDTVRRHTGHWTPAVHALLAHLQSVGFSDAPTVLGIDDQGREVLPFVSGEVGLLDPGQPLPPWRMYAGRALRDGEVVVHHDAAPYNTIRRPGGGLTVIDWDFCAPGDPVEDLAFAAWQWIPLWADKAAVAAGHGGAMTVTDPAFARLVDLGVARNARLDAEWVLENQTALSDAP